MSLDLIVTVPVRGGTLTGPSKAFEKATKKMSDTAERGSLWPSDNFEAMTVLVNGFHVLRGKPGTSPWDSTEFATWAASKDTDLTHATTCAVRFVLNVWNCSMEWDKWARAGKLKGWKRLKKFDFVDAMGCWDSENKAAFMAWALAPFWP